jgi:peptide/nickel transport system substrate-binding protein
MLFVLGLALFAGAAHRTSADTSAASIRDGGTLRINVIADFPSLDPALAYEDVAIQILAATCAKLVNFPDAPGSGARLRPEVAAAMPRVSADGRTYTFTLRRGYAFDTGAPVTPQSFVRALERVLSPEMQSPGSVAAM